MKKLSIIFISLMLSLNSFSQQTGDTIISNSTANLKLKVFYFHITNRCNTCISIETNVRKTIFENYKTQIDSGLINLYILNCELPENLDLVKKYEAYGATLAITPYKKGVELKTEDLSNWAFKTVHDPDVFISELKKKINEQIK